MAALPKPAATVILVRDGAEGLEVWLMERNRSVGFMASAWVFPGGRVDPEDAARPASGGDFSQVPRGFWVAAARELEEEAKLRLGGEAYDLDRLRHWAHWITPEAEPRRYDTHFFLARLRPGEEPEIDGGEAVDGRWFRPGEAVARSFAGDLLLAPPTVRCLQELSAWPDCESLSKAERRILPICPRFFLDGEDVYVLLPGDPEFPADPGVEPPTRFPIRGWSNEALKSLVRPG
jgi:8-oxo-dGTP pyrophosphatase MutT (NUDIX family)